MSSTESRDSSMGRDRSRRSRPFNFSMILTVLAGIIVVHAGVWLVLTRSKREDGLNVRVAAEAKSIALALKMYQMEFRTVPADNNHAIATALRGGNTEHKDFMDSALMPQSTNGDLLDPWGTPYQITLSPSNILIRSAGPNRQFEEPGDDYIYEANR